MYIRSLHLANLRCFKKADVTFQYPGRVPRAGEPPVATLATSLCSSATTGREVHHPARCRSRSHRSRAAPHRIRPQSLVPRTFGGASGPVPQELLKADVEVPHRPGTHPTERKERPQARNGKAGEYQLELGIKRIRDTEVLDKYPKESPLWQRMFEERTPGFLVVGYGANRWVAPKNVNVLVQFKENHIRYQRVRSLFEDGTALVPLSQWLPDLANRGRRRQVVTILNDFLKPHGYAFDGESENGELIFAHAAPRPLSSALARFPRFHRVGWRPPLPCLRVVPFRSQAPRHRRRRHRR